MVCLFSSLITLKGRAFAQGHEYYYLDGDSCSVWNQDRLRLWNLGSRLFCPATGGLRIIGQDMDIDDDGNFDLPVANWCLDPSWVYWGPDFSQRSEINTANQPEMWANGMFLTDIDGDGRLEITVANEATSAGSHVSSYIFSYAGNRLFELVDSVVYPYSCGAQSMQVADLNNDGYLDVIIANYRDYEAGEVELNSCVFLGPGPFWSKHPDYILPTHGGHPTSVADLNGDGFLDIVFSSNASKTGGWNTNLIIYWGPDYTVKDTTELPVCNNWENQVVDLNNDGNLDIIVVNGKDNTGYHTEDRIYWGPDYCVENSTQLPGVASSNITVADLDLDGVLDLLISNWGTGVHGAETLQVYSYIIYGPRFDPPDRIDSFQTLGAHGNIVADFNGDGWPDFFMGNEKPDWEHYYDTSFVFYNSPTGFDFQHPQKIETHAANDGPWTDLGNLYQRKPVERYISPWIKSAPSFGTVDSVLIYGQFPAGKPQLWIRAGKGPWSPVDSVSHMPYYFVGHGDSLQIRMAIGLDYKTSSAFRLDSVLVFFTREQVFSRSPEPKFSQDIRVPAAGPATVYNALGQAVARIDNAQHINALGLKPGVYYIFQKPSLVRRVVLR